MCLGRAKVRQERVLWIEKECYADAKVLSSYKMHSQQPLPEQRIELIFIGYIHSRKMGKIHVHARRSNLGFGPHFFFSTTAIHRIKCSGSISHYQPTLSSSMPKSSTSRYAIS